MKYVIVEVMDVHELDTSKYSRKVVWVYESVEDFKYGSVYTAYIEAFIVLVNSICQLYKNRYNLEL